MQYNTWTEATKLIRAMEDDITALAHSSANHVRLFNQKREKCNFISFVSLYRWHLWQLGMPYLVLHFMVH